MPGRPVLKQRKVSRCSVRKVIHSSGVVSDLVQKLPGMLKMRKNREGISFLGEPYRLCARCCGFLLAPARGVGRDLGPAEGGAGEKAAAWGNVRKQPPHSNQIRPGIG